MEEIAPMTPTIEDDRRQSIARPNKEWCRWLVIGTILVSVRFLLLDVQWKQTQTQRTQNDRHFGVVSSASSHDHHQQEVGSREWCSCFNFSANASCCQRAVLRAHKFGYMLTQGLFKPFPSVSRLIISPNAIPINGTTDYRHVVITRNIYDAMVSGYLYHKSGRECWLTFAGWQRPKSMGENNVVGWYPFIKQTAEQIGVDMGPIPERNNRSICRYLADEDEETGMKVYIAVALTKWYGGVVPYVIMVREMERQGRAARTMFVCLEDASDPQQEITMFNQMMDWLYPGGHNFDFPLQQVDNASYSGSHASDHDPVVRRRLVDLVAQFDHNLFHDTLSAMDSHFSCKPSTWRKDRYLS